MVHAASASKTKVNINAAASINGIVGAQYGSYGGVNANGEISETGGANSAGASSGYAGAAIDQGGVANNVVAANVEAARNSQSFDRAVNVVKRDRQRVGRNGQLLQSIAPHTNAT